VKNDIYLLPTHALILCLKAGGAAETPWATARLQDGISDISGQHGAWA